MEKSRIKGQQIKIMENEENENSTVQQPIKCYNCGGKGHMRRDC